MSDIEVDPNVSPALHPGSLAVFEEYDDDTRAYVGGATHALTVAYHAVASVHKAREAAYSNPTVNDAAAMLLVADVATKVQKRATVALYEALNTLSGGIKQMEAELNAPIQAAGSTLLAQEVRAHVKALSTVERLSFLASAQQRGDEATLRAVLGAPSYLSGITDEEKSLRTNMFHLARDPLTARRLALMKQVKTKLDSVGDVLHPGIEKAMGSTWAQVNVVREATNKAEKALANSVHEILDMSRFARS